jgi:hypothetical protein
MTKHRTLRLVKPKTKTLKRPLQVRYYKQADTMPDYPDSWGSPASEIGVIRGAMVLLMMGKYALARVYDTKTGRMKMALHAREGKFPEVRYGGQRLGTLTAGGKIKYGT